MPPPVRRLLTSTRALKKSARREKKSMRARVIAGALAYALPFLAYSLPPSIPDTRSLAALPKQVALSWTVGAQNGFTTPGITGVIPDSP
jgi:hypothetical protein